MQIEGRRAGLLVQLAPGGFVDGLAALAMAAGQLPGGAKPMAAEDPLAVLPRGDDGEVQLRVRNFIRAVEVYVEHEWFLLYFKNRRISRSFAAL